MSDPGYDHGQWKRGSSVTYEYVSLGRTFFCGPAIVMADDPDRAELFAPTGYRALRRTRADGTPLPRVVSVAEFAHLDHVLTPTWRSSGDGLLVVRSGDLHAVHVAWSASGAVERFYVNLQSPLQRTRTGFATTDHFLDIVVDADRRWRWKDEDELEQAVHVGRMTAHEADAVRAEGERVVAEIEAQCWPFDDSYEGWKPDPAWPVPAIPETWAEWT